MGHDDVSCSYCSCKKHNKISPDVHVSVNVEFVVVHPKRKFRIIHILPFSALHKCKREGESFSGVVQSEKEDITSTCVNVNPESHSPNHRWINKISCIWCCCENTDSVIPRFPFLLKYAENISGSIVTEAVRLVSCRKGSGTSSKSLNAHNFHSVSSECMNDNPLKTNGCSDSKLKEEAKCRSTQKTSCFPVFNSSRRGTLSKRLNCLLFFIHGLGGSADVWQYQLMFFSSQGYEVVAFDLLGHGMSTAPHVREMYTFSEMLNDILLIFDQYSKQRNVIIGHSYGCAFASSMCEKRSLAVKQLILISGGGPRALEPRHGLSVLFPVYGLALLKCLTCYYSGAERERASHLMELVRISALPRYVLKYVLEGQKWEQGDRSFYRSLYCPTLLVHGSKDYFISLNDEIEMEKTMPYAKLEVISNAGHTVMLDATDELNELIAKFLISWEIS